ncbi:hypothetical protein N9J83_05035 [Opitutales bacterium]|nr:hypothetical protein [Opitutales bacterium]MDB3959131.1 hypothetical protein [Opitutales bacterium]
MKLSYSVFSLLFFFLSSLHAKVEGPLDFTPPEGASVSFTGAKGIAMYSIDSADPGHSLTLINIPGVQAMNLEELFKTMTDTFVTEMNKQKELVGVMSPENPKVENFKGGSFSGKVVRFILKSGVRQSMGNINFYLVSNSNDTWNATVTGDEGWVAECDKLLASLKKK